jgi:hypothetical protein
MEIQAFRNNVKRKAVDDICEKPSKIINQGLAESPMMLNLINTKDVSNLRKCLYRKRRSQLPRDIFETQRTVDTLNPQTCKPGLKTTQVIPSFLILMIKEKLKSFRLLCLPPMFHANQRTSCNWTKLSVE